MQEFLRPGMGKDENSMGPEVGFGAIVGEHFEDKVTIIKVRKFSLSTTCNVLSMKRKVTDT